MDIYRDANASIEARVDDLISRMTLDEKLAQLGSIFASPLIEDGKFSYKEAGKYLEKGIGQISAAARSSGLTPDNLAKFANEVQKYLRENTRLGIPAIVHEECLNGFRAKGATIFPQNIGLASTWDTKLVGQITDIVRQQMRTAGVHQGLAPVADIARDPRWGRIEETFGEDPYLAAEMTIAYVKGLQGDDISRGVVATLKHFAGYGLPEGGMNCAPAQIPPRLFREVYLHPFEKAVKKGGVLSVMNAYHEIDGIPCGASVELLTYILRGEWGFEGIVVSDYYAIGQLKSTHKVCENNAEAAMLALTAGIDIELPKSECYAGPLKKQVEKGKVPVSFIDRAVTRLLRLKFKLGLFENPYVEPEETMKVIDTQEQRQLAFDAACKSIVLLKNETGLLPLDKDIKTLAVIGPNADSQRNLMGDYTYPSAENFGAIIGGPGVSAGKDEGDEKPDADRVETPEIISILKGIKEKAAADTKILYARGCEVTGASEEGIAEAVEAARAADVAVVAVGDRSGLGIDCTCGEMRDSSELRLPGVQEKLVKALCETGTPVVLVLVSGRPYVLGELTSKIPAIVAAWLPGEEGGRAVADVLFGDYNPGGKLPVTFPERVGQVPVYYSHKPSGGKAFMWGNYVDGGTKPLFEFGYGLSYTTFEFSNLEIKPDKIPLQGETTIRLEVENAGDRAGDEVVQLYINDIVASVTRPVKELKGFERVYLQPGEQRTVEFRLPMESLAFYDKKMECNVEPGIFKVMVGRSSEDILLEGEFEVEP
jgi:beta-glucosidase